MKNVFVEEAGDDAAKVAEASRRASAARSSELKYAIQVEEALGKKKILENYLNITFFGEQAYGIEAAAHALLLQAREGPDAQRVRSARRHRPVAEPL